MLETTQLRCFVAVAEELHFGRAAARLNMTQPPLSRQIQILERVMGCSLLERTSRSVKLTQAGEVLLSDAQVILRLIENATFSVKDVADGRKGVIRCGFTAASAYHFLPGLLERLNAALPNAALTLKEMISKRQIEALETGEIDIAFLRPPVDQLRFNSLKVFSEELKLVHHVDHPLGRKDHVGWGDLDKIDMIMYDSQDAQYFYDLLVSHLSRNAVFPHYRQRVGQIHTILSLVRARMGVAIVPESAGLMDVAELRYRTIEGDMPITAELYIAWQKENRKPLIPEVVRLACAMA